MKIDKTDKKVRRRDFLRALGASAGVAAATSGSFVENAVAATESDEERGKAQYQANSPEVQEYYRVNRYPPK
jgi:hypothetical protein